MTASVCATPAGAAVPLGEVFTPSGGSCGSNTTTAFANVAPATKYTVPSSGVITGWSYTADGTAPDQLRFKVGRPVGGSNWTVVARSSAVVPDLNMTNVYPIRAPVLAGDVIGEGFSAAGTFSCGRNDPAYDYVYRNNDPLLGATDTYAQAGDTFAIDIAATLEPDADGDCYGDESQDFCTSSAVQQTPCPARSAPDTTLTKTPKRKTKSRKAKFEFTATKPGSTFKCSLDGKPFSACTSPQKYKVKVGSHSFVVFGEDPTTNVDDTPATFSWKVKPKH
jgi:hypothetical protein